MKVTLVAPKRPHSIADRFIKAGNKPMQYPVALPLLAALTPSDVDIKIIDENIEDIDFEEQVDLVGISISSTYLAPRAYGIADEFRKRGVKVVAGGTHVTFLPEEAAEHCDSVVRGEAELIWPEIIGDFKKGRMKKFYQSDKYSDISLLPVPRKELLKLDKYVIDSVQTSRGCPHRCLFCAVERLNPKTCRYRPIGEVLNEIKESPFSSFEFIDVNFGANLERSKELFKSIVSQNITWSSDAPLYAARDKDFLKIARESGCQSLTFGFESIRAENLKRIDKTFNYTEEYREIIRRVHHYGIGVIGSFIFGLDGDDKNIFKEFMDFTENSEIDLFIPYILTPYPGTRIYEQFKQEGRILETDWEKYDSTHVVFQPRLLTAEELYKGMIPIWDKCQQQWTDYCKRYFKANEN